MKSVLQGIAVFTHPVFLPLFSILIYLPFLGKYSELAVLLSFLWLGFVYLLLPVIYFKWFRKINLVDPSIENRKTIYKTYLLINAGFSIVSIFLVREYFGFFIASGLLHGMLLLLTFIDLKASWHSAIWSFMACACLMIIYRYGLVGSYSTLAGIVGIWVLVFVVRWQQKAHSVFELGMGAAAGALTSTFILFLL